MTPDRAGGRGHRTVLAASAALLALGVVLLGWGTAGQQGDPPAPARSSTAGAAGAAPAPTEVPAPVPRAIDDPAPTGPDTARTSAPEMAGPTPDETGPPALAASAPTAVRIPAVGVSSPVHALGLEPDGTLQVPAGERYDQAAWYEGSPTPGERGPAVVMGHVTSRGSTPSVFFDLGALGTGDRVEVARADGSTAVFEVYATDRFPKDAFPTAAVYGNTDRPELRLITCGGEYDPDARAHLDNVVVFARLVGAEAPGG